LAWLKWGEFCPEKLIGDFAFAVTSPKTGVVFLARDVMGVKPLCYRADQQGVFFASSAAAFKPLQLGKLTRSRRWMAEFMLDLSYSHTDTAYEEIKKLQGAHCLLIHADGRMTLRRYHEFVDDAPVEKKRDPKYLEAYREAWQEAVACRMPASGNIGTENSGGLDSGSVTAALAKALGDEVSRLSGFGFCLEAQEPDCIMATAMQYGIQSNFLNAFEDNFLDHGRLSRQLGCYGYPLGFSTADEHSPFYEQCRSNGIGTLFSGFGGDEIVTNEESFSEYEALEAKHYKAFFRLSKGSVPRRIARTIKRSIMGMPDAVLANRVIAAYEERLRFNLLSDDVMQTFDLRQRFLAQAALHDGFRHMNAKALHCLALPFIPVRLENCSALAAAFGVDYVWPMLDARLVQRWLSTPSIWKLGDGGIRRYLHRSAIAGVCPDKITWKPSKDMGFPEKNEDLIDNKPALEAILTLLDAMPPALDMIIENSKAKKQVIKAINDDIRGTATTDSIRQCNNALSGLVKWLMCEIC
jgi:asparagine synthase (glutamine-hydrolysing)